MRCLMKLNIVMLSLFLLPIKVNCQNKINSQEYISKDSTINRDLYASINTGLFEWFGIGIGYQLSKEFAIELKHASTWLSGHGGNYIIPPYGSGVGAEIKYFSGNGVFNNISFSFTYLNTVPYKYEEIKEHGKSFELSTGYDNLEQSEKGKLYLFWSIGIGLGTTTAYKEILIMPTIKIGLTKNLF